MPQPSPSAARGYRVRWGCWFAGRIQRRQSGVDVDAVSPIEQSRTRVVAEWLSLALSYYSVSRRGARTFAATLAKPPQAEKPCGAKRSMGLSSPFAQLRSAGYCGDREERSPRSFERAVGPAGGDRGGDHRAAEPRCAPHFGSALRLSRRSPAGLRLLCLRSWSRSSQRRSRCRATATAVGTW